MTPTGRRARMRCALLAGFVLLSVATATPASSQPRRIVSLAPALTETVYALGAGDRLVGVSVYCDYPPEVAKVDKVGTFITPNVEAIVAKRPDLVLAMPSPGNRGSVEALRQLGLSVSVIDPTTVEEIEASFVSVGRLLGREAEGEALAASLRAGIETTRGRLSDAPRRKVLMVVGQTPLIAAGEGTVQDELIRMAGGINLGAQGGRGWPHLSIELAIAAAPEVIIDSTMGNEAMAGAAAATRFWDAFPTIPAVRNGRVVGFHAYELLRPGPRIGAAFEQIARFLHPERFAPLDDRGEGRPDADRP